MTTHIRLALVAGALAGAIALAGCERDASDIATGPAPGAPATRSAAAPPAAGPQAPPPAARPPAGEPFALNDAFTGSGWTDADGHRYTVLFGVGSDGGVNSVQHFRDGILFAVLSDQANGTKVSYYDQGTFIQDQFILAGAPQATRRVGGGAERPPVPDDDARPGPQRQMVFPCNDEVNGYLLASGEMIGAVWYYQRNPGSRKAQAALTTAIVNFALAWHALWNCEMRESIVG